MKDNFEIFRTLEKAHKASNRQMVVIIFLFVTLLLVFVLRSLREETNAGPMGKKLFIHPNAMDVYLLSHLPDTTGYEGMNAYIKKRNNNGTWDVQYYYKHANGHGSPICEQSVFILSSDGERVVNTK